MSAAGACAVRGCGGAATRVELKRFEGEDFEARLRRMGFVEVSPPAPLASADLCEAHRDWLVGQVGAKHRAMTLQPGDVVWYG